MKNNILSVFLLIMVLSFTSGCAPLIIGAAVGAVGGYAASKDTIQGDSDISYNGLWNAALSVARIRGTITIQDQQKGVIDLTSGNNKVYMRLLRLTRATTRIKVSARKNHLPDLDLAKNIFDSVMEQAR